MSMELVTQIDDNLDFTISSSNDIEGNVNQTNELSFDIESSYSIDGIADSVKELEFNIISIEQNDLNFTAKQEINLEGSVSIDNVYRGIGFTTDETLRLYNGVLSVNRATEPEEDNTLPITAAAVHTTVGNIEILLKTI